MGSSDPTGSKFVSLQIAEKRNKTPKYQMSFAKLQITMGY